VCLECCSWTIQCTGQLLTFAVAYAVSLITFTLIPLVIYAVYFVICLHSYVYSYATVICGHLLLNEVEMVYSTAFLTGPHFHTSISMLKGFP